MKDGRNKNHKLTVCLLFQHFHKASTFKKHSLLNNDAMTFSALPLPNGGLLFPFSFNHLHFTLPCILATATSAVCHPPINHSEDGECVGERERLYVLCFVHNFMFRSSEYSTESSSNLFKERAVHLMKSLHCITCTVKFRNRLC